MEAKKRKMDRRTFLKTTGMGSASLVLSSGLAGGIPAAETGNQTVPKAIPARVLGKTGVPVPILALGGIIDWTTNQALLRMAFNMGITYWDTSHAYMNGKSEIGIGEYFSKYPDDRKKIFLVSKASGADTPEGMTERLDLSLERMKTDSIDLYFLHGPKSTDVFTEEVKAWAEQKKKEGKIKFFGFSVHMNTPQMLMHASTLGWIDAVMPTYNYRTMITDDTAKAIDACAKANIGLVAMKVMAMPVSQPDSPEELAVIQHFMDSGFTVEQAKLKAVWKDERIAASCVAIKSLTVLKDNVAAAADNKQLSRDDMKMLYRLADSTCNYYCRGCARCESVMGPGSRIPDVMRYLMYYNSYGDRDEARKQFRELPETVKRNLASMDYSSAEAVCPQRIRIGAAMREAAGILV